VTPHAPSERASSAARPHTRQVRARAGRIEVSFLHRGVELDEQLARYHAITRPEIHRSDLAANLVTQVKTLWCNDFAYNADCWRVLSRAHQGFFDRFRLLGIGFGHCDGRTDVHDLVSCQRCKHQQTSHYGKGPFFKIH
jgi:hypothetical protein